jgi:hypothetical protein
MVESINGTSPVPTNLSPHTAARNDNDDHGKTADSRESKLNNNATLSVSAKDSGENRETAERKAVLEDGTTDRAPEPTHNEPPGSRVDILA